MLDVIEQFNSSTMSMDTDAYFEKLLLLSVKQQDVEKNKRLKICELQKRNVSLRQENEALVAILKSLEEEQHEQWKYIDELFQITVSKLRSATGGDGEDAKESNAALCPKQPAPQLKSENEAATDDFLQTMNTLPSPAMSGKQPAENKQTQHSTTMHDRRQSTTIPPPGMCYTIRKLRQYPNDLRDIVTPNNQYTCLCGR